MSDEQNLALMESIHSKYGAAIEAACKGTPIRQEFVAALIANESGGNPNARRFEKGVLAALWEVLLGRKATYGSIGRDDLFQYLSAGLLSSSTAAGLLSGFGNVISTTLRRFDDLASSHGLTQIMGYEVFSFSSIASTIDKLHTTEGSLAVTILMLQQFARRWHFDLGTDFDQMFDAWNTGRPHAPTADPKYIPNGIMRMQLYLHVETPT